MKKLLLLLLMGINTISFSQEIDWSKIPLPSLSAGITLDTIDYKDVSITSLYTLDLTIGFPIAGISKQMGISEKDLLAKLPTYNVTKFTVTLYSNGQANTRRVSGSQLSEEVKKWIRIRSKGDRVIIDDIFYTSNGKTIKYSGSLSFIMK